jgi:hypothetical protein
MSAVRAGAVDVDAERDEEGVAAVDMRHLEGIDDHG